MADEKDIYAAVPDGYTAKGNPRKPKRIDILGIRSPEDGGLDIVTYREHDTWAVKSCYIHSIIIMDHNESIYEQELVRKLFKGGTI